MKECYRDRRIIVKGKQKCFRCGKMKLIREFWVDKNRYLDIRGVCKFCMKEKRNKIKKKQEDELE